MSFYDVIQTVNTLCLYIYIYTYIHIYVYMYIYIYTLNPIPLKLHCPILWSPKTNVFIPYILRVVSGVHGPHRDLGHWRTPPENLRIFVPGSWGKKN